MPLAVPPALASLREAWVPTAALGVPPHITVVPPFIGPASVVAEAVRDLVAAEHAFHVEFATTRRFVGVLWAAPDDAASRRCRRLTDGLVARLRLVGAFDDEPLLDAWVPHLTLVEGQPEAMIDRLEAVARATGAFPFVAEASSLDLLAQGADGGWRVAGRFPLRP